MGKVIAILILFIYSLLNTGANLHLHFCKGDLKHVGLGATEDSCCPHSEDHHETTIGSNCCTDENINFSIDDEHVVSSTLELNMINPIEIVDYTSPLIKAEIERTVELGATDSAPPVKRPLYTLFSSRIYYA
jgi:hypothetical protein